jgi:hypothetical protein
MPRKEMQTKKSLPKRERTELSFIWLSAVILLLGLIAIPTLKDGGITGYLVAEGIGPTGGSVLMWVVLLGVVVVTAFFINKNSRR